MARVSCHNASHGAHAASLAHSLARANAFSVNFPNGAHISHPRGAKRPVPGVSAAGSFTRAHSAAARAHFSASFSARSGASKNMFSYISWYADLAQAFQLPTEHRRRSATQNLPC